MLVIYVDDLKMAGPATNMAQGWAMLREVLGIDGPLPVDLFLGMSGRSPVWGRGQGRSDYSPPGPISIMTYNMEALSEIASVRMSS